MKKVIRKEWAELARRPCMACEMAVEKTKGPAAKWRHKREIGGTTPRWASAPGTKPVQNRSANLCR